ncbi:MAG: CARDB domain-containing protein [Candidatus Paceibacterota bacterium]
MKLFKKSFVGVLVLIVTIISFVGFSQRAFAYENTFDIFENWTTIRFVSVKETIPDITNYPSTGALMIAGQMETDNRIFSLGNTTVSMKATLYSVGTGGAETIVVPSQYIISPSNLVFTTHDTVSGNTSFNLAPLLGNYRIKIEAKAFGDKIENRTYDFSVYNPATIVLNMWATPSSVYYGGSSVIHWQNYPTTGISCWWLDASAPLPDPTSGSITTTGLLQSTVFSYECNNGAGGQVVTAEVIVNVVPPSITANTLSPVYSNDGSFINYSALGSKSCNIVKIDSVGGVTDSGGLSCPTSGRYYTGALTNTGSSNITTHYSITCGVGGAFNNPASGDCNGPGASGNMAFSPADAIYSNTKNDIPKVAIIEKVKNFFSNIIPKIFAEGVDPGNISVIKDVSIVIQPAVPPPDEPVATLDLDQTQIKNVVKKGVPDPIGTAYLKVNVKNITGSCDLINTSDSNPVTNNYGTFYDSTFIQNKTVSNLQLATNNFQLDCTNSSSPSLKSVIVPVSAQSGDLACTNCTGTTTMSCTIPIGGSSCPGVTLNWGTTSPYSSVYPSNLYTKITRDGLAVFSPTNTGSGITNIYHSSYGAIYKAENTVDDEGNTMNIRKTAPNELDTITINTVCASDSEWSIVTNKCEATTAPIPPTGVITAPDCLIALGAGSCNTNVKWETYNPKPSFISAVTTPTNITVGTGNTNNTGVPYPVAFGTREFFLYHANAPLGSVTATADCTSGTVYNTLSKKCEATTNPTGVLNVTNCIIPTGAGTCATKLTWSTSNPKAGVTSKIITPTNIIVATGNNSSLPFSYSMAYGVRKFDLSHNNVVLSSKNARAMCSAFTGDVWNGTTCAKQAKGTLTATNCVIPIGASSCMTDLTWSTTNPNAGVTSQVTTPKNVVVATANNGTKKWSVDYGSRDFYLYNSTLLDQAVAMADCDTATSKWDESVCVASAVISADLVASNPSPASAVAGVSTVYKSTITNQGTASTILKFENLFQTATGFADPVLQTGPIDLKDYPDGAMPALGIGASAISSVNITFPVVGNYYIRACADKNSAGDTGAIAESNESNNCSGSWSQVKVIAADALRGTLTGPNCTILSGGNSCNTTLAWTIDNTEAIPSQITANDMSPINLSTPTIGNDYSGTKTYTFTSPSAKIFYLYNNAKSLVPTAESPNGKGLIVQATCTIGTSWDGNSCEPIAVDGICGVVHNLCSKGTMVDNPDSPAFHLWTCEGSGGGTNASCSEAKIQPIVITFIATPDKVLKGRSSTLTWSADNATSCSSPDFDTQGAAQNMNPGVKVTPTSTKTYTLTCTNGTSSPSSVATVKVIIPVIKEN